MLSNCIVTVIQILKAIEQIRSMAFNSDIAVAYGLSEGVFNVTNILKRYELTFLSGSIKMNIYDSNGNFEETYYFYR